MSAYEFGLHWASYRRNPWGVDRDAVHFAQVVQAIGNYAGKTRKDALKLGDCIIKFVNPNDERDVEPEIDPATFFKQS